MDRQKLNALSSDAANASKAAAGTVQAAEMDSVICRIEDFSLSFEKEKKWYPAVSHINLDIHAGEMAALIGESGCGKSVTALSMMGLQPEKAEISGQIFFEGNDLTKLTEKQWAALRGNRISMIFQEPMTALNPLIKVGKQIAENLRHHQKIGKAEAKQKVLSMMRQVGLPDVEAMYDTYPHQLSGGQRQRIMIAMAFINDPALLIADEPTTALDVTIQAQIMELMRKMNRELGSAVLLISHDLGVVKRLCSRVFIMYAGHVVESGSVGEILRQPMHPYTKGLVAAIPSASRRGQELASIPGTVPGIFARPESGCAFCGRCAWKKKICETQDPPVIDYGGRRIQCHLTAEEMLVGAGCGQDAGIGSQTADDREER